MRISMLLILLFVCSFLAEAAPIIGPNPIKTPIIILTPIPTRTPIVIKTPAPTPTPIVIPTYVPTPSDTLGCVNPTLQNCQDTGMMGRNCRRFQKDICANLIKADYERQLESLPSSSKIVTNLRTKDPVTAKKTNNFAKEFTITGHNSSIRDMQAGHDIAVYQQQNNLVLSPSSIAALLKRRQWLNYTGYASCEDFALKSFPKLQKIETLLTRFPFDITQSMTILSNDYDLARAPLAVNPVLVKTGMFKRYETRAGKPFVDVFGAKLSLIVATRGGNESLYHKNDFLNPNYLDDWYPKICTNNPHPGDGMPCMPPYPDPKIYIPQNLKLKIHMAESYKVSRNLSTQLAMANELRNIRGYSDDYLEEMAQAQLQYRLLWQKRAEIRKAYENYTNRDSLETALALAAIDKQIIESLRQASVWGCFEADSSVTPCDWSPSLMRATLDSALKPIRDYREETYRFCQEVANDVTVGRISTVTYKPNYRHLFLVATEQPAETPPEVEVNKFINNSEMFDRYIPLAADYYRLVAEEMEQIRFFAKAKDAQGLPELGELRADSGFLGSDFLGLGEIGGGYDYSLDWKVTDYKDNVCKPSFQGNYNYNAYSKLFGKKLNTLRFSAGVNTNGQNKKSYVSSLVEIKGNIYSDQFETVRGSQAPVELTNNFNYVTTPEAWGQNFGQFGQVIVVAGIPVTLSGGAAYQAGYSVNLTNGFNDDACPVVNGTYVLKDKPFQYNRGSLSPYARAILFASASVDAGIVEVGVRGSVNLIEISLPWNINNEMKSRIKAQTEPNRQADFQPTLYANNSIDLRVNTLAGSVSAFVDYTLKSLDYELFSWGGVNTDENLTRSSTNFSLQYSKEALKKP